MGYDEKLAFHITEILKTTHNVSQKKMFGGLCFLLSGNMLCGIVKDNLVARVGPEIYEVTLKLKHTAPMDFTGKPMKGMVYVLPEGLKTRAAIKKWIEKSLAFVEALHRKKTVRKRRNRMKNVHQ